MTKRENYTRILQKKRGEKLPFVPNIDHWLNVNRRCGTLPEEYQNMTRNDIVRTIGGTIWARTNILKTSFDSEIKIIKKESGDKIITNFKTPVGDVQTVHQYASDFSQALFLKEHRVKRVEDIKVVKFIIEHTQYILNPGPFYQSEREVGEDGISLVDLPVCLPYIQFGKIDAGWERGIYLYADYPAEVENLLEIYTQKAEEAASLLASGPALVIASGDNMDEWTTPPNVFQKHAIPYYRRIGRILHCANKVFEVHWCGRTEHLLSFVPKCDIDVVEAVTVKPMANLTIPEALEMVGSKVVIQGGIPSILMCSEGGGTRQNLRAYIEQLLSRVPFGYRFVLGMSDNIPPNADFERVKMITKLI